VDQVRAAVDVLADALVDDPSWTHVVPDDAARWAALRGLLGIAIRDARPPGAVLAAEDGGQLAGAAVWLPPGTFTVHGLPLRQTFLSGR